MLALLWVMSTRCMYSRGKRNPTLAIGEGHTYIQSTPDVANAIAHEN